MSKEMTRRQFLRLSVGLSVGILAAACQPPAPTPAPVEKEVTRVVKETVVVEKVVTSEAAPAGQKFAGKEVSVVTLDGELSNGVEAQIPFFEEKHGAKVNFSKLPDVHTKVTADLSTGTGFYDAIIEPFLFLHGYAAADFLVPIDDFVSADPEIDVDDFIPLLFQSHGYYNGKLYALPYKADAYVFFHRKDLLADPKLQEAYNAKSGKELKVPETVDELVETARFFTKKFNPDSPTDFGWAHMAERGNGAIWIWASRLAVYGGGYLDANYHPNFNNEAGQKAMEVALKLNECCPPDLGTYGWEESNTAYLTGKVMMMEQWPGLSKMAETEEGFWGRSAVIGKTGYAVPAGDVIGGKLIRSSVLGGWAGAVSKYAKDKELAYQFIAYVTSKEAEPLKIPGGNDPCRRSTYANPEIAKGNPLYPTLLACLEEARITADIDAPPVSDQLQEVLRTDLHRVWIGEIKGDEALNHIEQEWLPILKEANLYK